MAKLLEIKVTKSTLYLYENELFQHLPTEILKKAITRGKAIKRANQASERQKGKNGDDSN